MNEDFEDARRFFESERRALRMLLAVAVLAFGLVMLVAASGCALA